MDQSVETEEQPKAPEIKSVKLRAIAELLESGAIKREPNSYNYTIQTNRYYPDPDSLTSFPAYLTDPDIAVQTLEQIHTQSPPPELDEPNDGGTNGDGCVY